MTQDVNYKNQLEAAQQEIDRLKRERAEAIQRYTNLFENAGDSIFLIDSRTYTIMETNAHAARRLGYAPDEIIGMSLDDIEVVDADDKATQLAWVSAVSGTQVFECHYRHKDGHLIPVEVSSRFMQVGDREIIQNFVREISVRREMEAEREALLGDLDSFAHMVAHDLKSPIANIITAVEMLQGIWEEATGEEIENILDIILTNGQIGVNIIQALLTFASVRSQHRVTLTTLDMGAIISAIERRFAAVIASQNVQFQMPDRWLRAVGHPPWVEEMWANYISNAIKYGGDPPVIELGATPEPDGMIRFWVRDNGGGIAEDRLPDVFDEFTRLDEMHIEGHGLGLSVVRRIAERLGGQVGVESTVGQGSTFSFTLPAAEG